MASQPVVVVAGPTASGKSALALDLARCLNGVIINADALQLYRDLPILTARPGTAMMAAAPHQLFGILDPDEVSSAGWWRRQAQQTIEATLAQGKLPILVGGTGLYLRSLMEGISSIPPIPQPIRDATRQHLQGVGHEAFHAELSQLDPE
ncbi:MAG: tRNA (adenosine(37)-N6)-dimethylallyltransferase, partial [Dongiaceae bacterium]